MDEWHIDVCVGASQKCLGAPPGLAPVAVGQRAWEIMKAKPQRSHGWYLNLEVWQWHAKEWWDWHPFPVTMATSNVLALREGVRSLISDGLDARINRYTELANRLRAGIQRLGLQLFAPEECLAPVLTGIRSPDGVLSGDIVDYLYREHGIKIAGGLGAELRDRIFRIGHMGPRITERDIDAVLEGLASFFKDS
jgi:alanine-glyoxylate transaminase/serine-glyoxylate transaminase/serine-pyruvate transaminase